MYNQEMNNDKIKEDFISTLSHEIRTPLTSIKGFSDTILENWERLDEDKKKKFVSIISSQAERLIGLVENVLNVAKIDSGFDKIIFKEINLENALNSAISVIRGKYKDFEFEIEKTANLPSVMADADKLQQILINILDNATKYSNNSKTVKIKLSTKDSEAVVSIKNFGVEIKKEDLNKIFQKFYRADNILTNKTQGSGLGLYITKNLLEKTGGKIDAQSFENSTEFSIYLPIYEIEKVTKTALKKDIGNV